MLQKNKIEKKKSMLVEQPRPGFIPQLQQILASAEANEARVIGITSHMQCAGVSTLAQQLALYCLAIGRPVTLADFSKGNFKIIKADAADRNWSELSAEKFFPGGIDNPDGDEPLARKSARDHLSALRETAETLIVDLPPACGKNAAQVSRFLDAAPGCDQIFMLCVTGKAYESEVRDSLAVCSMGGVTLAGLILNDFKLGAANLLGWRLPV